MFIFMVGEFADFFTQLFLGTGHWLGLIIIIMLLFLFRMVNKYSVIIAFPLSLLIGFEYLTNDLGWDALIIWLSSVALLITISHDVK
jgi:hypothetical protein